MRLMLLGNHGPFAFGSVLRAAVWTPAQLPQLSLWLDAADSSTITLNGSTVSQWNDKSGNAYHFAQVTATNQPVYSTGALNGKNVINFVSADSLTRAAIPFNDLGNNSLYVVGNRTGAAGAFSVAVNIARASSRTRSVLFEYGSTDSGKWGTYDYQPAPSPAGFVDATYKICEMIADQDTNSYQFYQDGTSQGSNGVVAVNTVFSFATCYIGNDQFNSWLDGNIAEVIFCDEKNSDADRQKLEGYLAWKWGGDALWTPAQLTNLAMWLDAADESTITLNGSTVAQWNDKSGNGRHVIQSTSTNQPTYSATGLNGKPTIDFDGFNDFLKNATFQPAGAVSCVLVFNRDTTGGAFINIQRTDGVFEIGGVFGAAYTDITFTATGAMPQSLGFNIAGSGANQNAILGIQYDGSGSAPADFVARLDGSNQSIVNSGALGFVAETGFSIGARPVQQINFYDGLISEIIFTNYQLTLSDIQKTEGYLAHKWGLVADLPATHPYKYQAPRL